MTLCDVAHCNKPRAKGKKTVCNWHAYPMLRCAFSECDTYHVPRSRFCNKHSHKGPQKLGRDKCEIPDCKRVSCKHVRRCTWHHYPQRRCHVPGCQKYNQSNLILFCRAHETRGTVPQDPSDKITCSALTYHSGHKNSEVAPSSADGDYLAASVLEALRARLQQRLETLEIKKQAYRNLTVKCCQIVRLNKTLNR